MTPDGLRELVAKSTARPWRIEYDSVEHSYDYPDPRAPDLATLLVDAAELVIKHDHSGCECALCAWHRRFDKLGSGQ